MQLYTNCIAAYCTLENARRIIVARLPLVSRLASRASPTLGASPTLASRLALGASPTLGASSALGSRLALGARPTLGAYPF